MISEKDITDAEDQEKVRAETYLKGVIDFFQMDEHSRCRRCPLGWDYLLWGQRMASLSCSFWSFGPD